MMRFTSGEVKRGNNSSVRINQSPLTAASKRNAAAAIITAQKRRHNGSLPPTPANTGDQCLGLARALLSLRQNAKKIAGS